MNFVKYTAQTAEAVLKEFGVTPEQGLSEKAVLAQRKLYGDNHLAKHEVSGLIIFLRQFKSAFIYLLIAAAVITFFLKEYLDSFLIILFVGINALLGFYQEFKSEQTTKLLKKYTDKRATVIRDGKEEVVNAGDLVIGDVVLIETGDIVPADLRLVQEENLYVDESTLTGESVQIKKSSTPLDHEQKDLYKALNIVFSGTTVAEGKACGIVIAVGKETELGRIAQLTTAKKEVSGLEKEISKFSTFILLLTSITLIGVFAVHVFVKSTVSVTDLIIFSIALAVGVIPEAMPLVTTFSLSMGAAKLAKKNVIVKRLSSIEDLGSVQVLCTDKTGTITENKLQLRNIFSEDSDKTLLLGLLASSGVLSAETPNNAFDLAIYNKVHAQHKDLLPHAKKIFEIPFNPNRRKNSVLVKYNGKQELIVRGAVESVMPAVVNLSHKKNAELMHWVLEEGHQGKRVLAIAYKEFGTETYLAKDEESALTLAGLISFEDPIKDSTEAAVKKAKSFGVTIKIITGDSPEVAGAVGVQVGIANNRLDVITGDQFEDLNHHEQKAALEKINVFARVSPEQKYNIIKLLQESFEVGYLGEGINDAPALKLASVSIVVDTAADVSREVADIILLKHDLKVIVDGIELGRKTFVNVTNYIKTTLSSNFGNFYAMAFATLLIDYLPMLPIQILLVNLLSDFPMISIATDNVETDDLKSPKTYAVKELILVATLLGLVSTAFDFMFFGLFKQFGAGVLQTNWFIGSILTELILIYSIRTKGWFFKVKNLPSKTVVVLTFLAAFFTIFIPLTSFGAQVFGFVKPLGSQLLVIFAVVFGYLVSTELVKRFYYRYLGSMR